LQIVADPSEKSRSNFIRCWPPSTSSVVPVIERFSSAKRTAATTSSGVDERPSGDSLCSCSNFSCDSRWLVSVRPGATPTTRSVRRQRLRQQRGGRLQRRLRQRVAEEVGVRVPQLLVQQVDHRAVRAARLQVLVQRLRQQRPAPRCWPAGAPAGAHTKALDRVVLEQRGVVDHRVDRAEVRPPPAAPGRAPPASSARSAWKARPAPPPQSATVCRASSAEPR
jgi:hypothetical protein